MDTQEQQLVHRVREGAPGAFRELVKQFREPIFIFSQQLTGDWDEADDLSQEVFIKAYRGIGRYRGEAKMISWLYRIAVNTHIDNVRRRKPWDRRSGQPSIDDTNAHREQFVDDRAEHNPEQQTAARHIREHIDGALKTLPPQQRAVFVLRHYHDLPLKEVAGVLGISLGAVKSQLFRGIRRLRGQLAFYREELGLGESS